MTVVDSGSDSAANGGKNVNDIHMNHYDGCDNEGDMEVIKGNGRIDVNRMAGLGISVKGAHLQ